MAGGGQEIELKFQVPAAGRARLRRAFANGTALRLLAQYLDTADSRLAQAGLALRLRREGQRWVQTLKGRGDGLAQRLEDEVPLPPVPPRQQAAGRQPPAVDPQRHDGTAVGRLLSTALAGAGPLVERYRTDIRRRVRVLRHGGARIELALDEGAIRCGSQRVPVCEVEFELLAGPRTALLALAAQWAQRYGLVLDTTSKAERGHRLAEGMAPPPPTGATPVALPSAPSLAAGRAAMVAAALRQALPNASALATGCGGDEHVHQLRVALRRLRTVLRAFGPGGADPEAPGVGSGFDRADGPVGAGRDRAIAALFATLGADRDRSVIEATLQPAWVAARQQGLAVPAATRLRAATTAAAVAVLQQPQTTLLWLDLLKLTEPPGTASQAEDPPLAEVAAAELHKLRRRCRRDLKHFDTLDDPARHALRKRLKRLRYLLDACVALLPRRATERELKALSRLQDALGHWHDLAMALTTLGALARPTPAQRFAQGWLAHEQAAAVAACTEAGRRWHAARPPR